MSEITIEPESPSSTGRRSRIVSKTDILVMHRPRSRRHKSISVRVTVGRGSIEIQSMQRKIALRKISVDATHDLKAVWINDMLDDDSSGIKNCFAVLTPEDDYILQADNNRTKIEWMQAISVAISQSLKFRGSYRPSNWSKLDDLRRWLSVREVEYHYKTHPLYKGAIYTGKWNIGMPHICGSIKWTNGDRYEGEFLFGKSHGTGTRIWLSHSSKRSYTGSWQDGMIEGYGEMTYLDHSVYTGWWHMGKRCGHGRLEYPQGRGSYIGSWEADKRNGYGVYDNVVKSERYLGMWKNDKQHGPGILVAKNKFYYSGHYENGEKKLFGSRSTEYVNQDEKWSPLFHSCSAMLEQMVSVSHSNSETRPQSTSAYSDTDSAVAMDFSDLGASPEMESSCRTCQGSLKEDEECVVCRVEGFKSVDHPLGLLVNNITKCFNESYSGLGVHENLLSHAVGELCSITTRLHHIVKMHCPSLISIDEDDLLGKPNTQLSLLLKSRKGLRRTSHKGFHGTDPSWLHPILLPSIFKSLFGLYVEHNHEEDNKLNQKIVALNDLSDEELCQLLGIQKLYQDWTNRKLSIGGCLQSTTPMGDTRTSEGDGVDRSFFDGCDSAIQILQRIGQYSTPQNKLLCAQETNGELTKFLEDVRAPDVQLCADPFESDNNDGMNTRDSRTKKKSVPVSLFSLVIIRSRVNNLCSEIQFIQDFAGTPLLAGKEGFLLGKLQECHFELQEIDQSANRTRLVTYVR